MKKMILALMIGVFPASAFASVTCELTAEMKFYEIESRAWGYQVAQDPTVETQTHKLEAATNADCVAAAWEFVSDYKKHQSEKTGRDAFFKSGHLVAGKTQYSVTREMYADGKNSRLKIRRN
ncbi:MAG: hypothetical protein JNL01_00675 [Bdellovibrionales bacterium]|nr:hypothetical protein [Bdellovibrionales bacterium]